MECLQPLLLKNGGEHQNMCSLNSNLQLLRHVPEFISHLDQHKNDSALCNVLYSILSTTGSHQQQSALLLREILANVTQRDLNSGAQNDAVELLSYILDHCPTDLFHFDTSFDYTFHNEEGACPKCKGNPQSVPGTDKILKLILSKSQPNPSLNDLLEKLFAEQEQTDGRRCSQCAINYKNTPLLPYTEKLCMLRHPPYLLIQLLRMSFQDGTTTKNSSPITLPKEVMVDKVSYQVIGTITHIGTASAGHNRAFLKQGEKWFMCEDSRYPFEKNPVDSVAEQNYCLLLKKVEQTSLAVLELRQCSVVIEKLNESKRTYADVVNKPSQFSRRKTCSLENISSYVKNSPTVKRSFSSTESLNFSDSPIEC